MNVYLNIFLSLFLIGFALWGALVLPQNDCEMTYMHPRFLKVKVHSSGRYALYLYREMTSKRTNEPGVPVLFVPGNAGSYKQARSVGAEVARTVDRAARVYVDSDDGRRREAEVKRDEPALPLDVFTIDYNEELSALSGDILMQQAWFANECLEAIAEHYESVFGVKRTELVTVAHSMGAVIARLMPTLSNYAKANAPRIVASLALNAPVTAPVVAIHSSVESVYEHIEEFWSSEDADATPIMHVSIGGGRRDTLVRSSLCALPDTDRRQDASLSVLSTAIRGVWVSTDHQCSTWCNQLIRVVAHFLVDIADADHYVHFDTLSRKAHDTFDTASVDASVVFARSGSSVHVQVADTDATISADRWAEDAFVVDASTDKVLMQNVWSIDSKREKYVKIVPPCDNAQFDALVVRTVGVEKADLRVFTSAPSSSKASLRAVATAHYTVDIPRNGLLMNLPLSAITSLDTRALWLRATCGGGGTKCELAVNFQRVTPAASVTSLTLDNLLLSTVSFDVPVNSRHLYELRIDDARLSTVPLRVSVHAKMPRVRQTPLIIAYSDGDAQCSVDDLVFLFAGDDGTAAHLQWNACEGERETVPRIAVALGGSRGDVSVRVNVDWPALVFRFVSIHAPLIYSLLCCFLVLSLDRVALLRGDALSDARFLLAGATRFLHELLLLLGVLAVHRLEGVRPSVQDVLQVGVCVKFAGALATLAHVLLALLLTALRLVTNRLRRERAPPPNVRLLLCFCVGAMLLTVSAFTHSAVAFLLLLVLVLCVDCVCAQPHLSVLAGVYLALLGPVCFASFINWVKAVQRVGFPYTAPDDSAAIGVALIGAHLVLLWCNRTLLKNVTANDHSIVLYGAVYTLIVLYLLVWRMERLYDNGAVLLALLSLCVEVVLPRVNKEKAD